jgi:hypothetical protein
MNKQRDKSRGSESPFNALLVRRAVPAPVGGEEVVGAVGVVGDVGRKLKKAPSKSADPEYTKVTWYLRGETHRAFKSRTASQGREMSDVAESLVTDWLNS